MGDSGEERETPCGHIDMNAKPPMRPESVSLAMFLFLLQNMAEEEPQRLRGIEKHAGPIPDAFDKSFLDCQLLPVGCSQVMPGNLIFQGACNAFGQWITRCCGFPIPEMFQEWQKTNQPFGAQHLSQQGSPAACVWKLIASRNFTCML